MTPNPDRDKYPRDMRHFLAVALIVLGLTGLPVWAALPSAEEIARVKASIAEMTEGADTSEIEELLKEKLAEIITEYGINGVAYIALSEPALMEALLLTPSLGYKTVVKAVVEVATNAQELEQNLVSVATAQLSIGRAIDEAVTQEIILSNAAASDVPLQTPDVGELVASVSQLAMNAQSNGSGNDSASIGESQSLSQRLADIVNEAQFSVDPSDRIISQVK